MLSVLLVDDDPQQLGLRKLLLKAAGLEVTAANGEPEAARALEELRPDVLLMDLRLPQLEDGLNLIRRASQVPYSPKIIVLSGWTEDLSDLPEKQLVSRILGKPIRHECLVAAINAAVSAPGRNRPPAAS